MAAFRAVSVFAVGMAALVAQSGRPPATPAHQIDRTFSGVNAKVIAMAKDFPADKYDFRLKPEMRSFGEVLVHIASGNAYAAKAGRGEKAKWEEFDAKNYAGKDAIVALVEKSAGDAEAVLKGLPEAAFAKSVQPWVGVLEHTAEHYGLLVAYYRANGIVPPDSRPTNSSQ